MILNVEENRFLNKNRWLSWIMIFYNISSIYKFLLLTEKLSLITMEMVALFDFSPSKPEELRFERGDTLKVKLFCLFICKERKFKTFKNIYIIHVNKYAVNSLILSLMIIILF